ncbi:MAG: hypothetical protein A2Y91_02300 [Chloroflexi bacterium RBG_13_54_8]|nr:MAG: hypothetical protein A2Y91_02300 [Chloroflexi bacterium RBG_13_54_8]
MNKKAIMVTTLVLLAALLAALPGLVGCGKEEVVTGTFSIGWLQDLTGRAGFGVKQVYDGLDDYIRKTTEEDPIPGVRIKLLAYDTKSDYGRVVPGYVWLRGQKATLLSVAAHDATLVADRFAADQWPVFYMSNMPQMLTNEWYYTVYGTSASMVETLLQSVRETWDYGTKGKPKVGVLTYAGVVYYEDFLNTTEAVISQYPDKYDWVGAQKAPTTTTAWATEVFKLKDCDIIFCFLSGTPLASFVKEARDRGFKGEFMGPLDSFPAYWGLVRAAVPVAQLDGIISALGMPAIDEPNNPLINEVKAYMQQYRTADQIKNYSGGTGYSTGWAMGKILVDIVKRAAAEVGAENVGNIAGSTLRDLIRETNLTVDGWGETFKYRGNLGALSRTAMMYRFSAAEDKWVSISGWFVPASLAVAGE